MFRAPANLPFFVDLFLCHVHSWRFSAACLACPQRAVSALFSWKAAAHTFTRHIYQHQYDFCHFSKGAVEISQSRMCLCLDEPSPGDGQLGGKCFPAPLPSCCSSVAYKTWSETTCYGFGRIKWQKHESVCFFWFMDFILVVIVTLVEVCKCSISLACQL